jgi:hypothetical protein
MGLKKTGSTLLNLVSSKFYIDLDILVAGNCCTAFVAYGITCVAKAFVYLS